MRKPPLLARLITAALIGVLLAQAYGTSCNALTARGRLKTPKGEYGAYPPVRTPQAPQAP